MHRTGGQLDEPVIGAAQLTLPLMDHPLGEARVTRLQRVEDRERDAAEVDAGEGFGGVPVDAVRKGLETDRGAAPEDAHDALLAIGRMLDELDRALAHREHGVGALTLAVQQGLAREDARPDRRHELVQIATAQHGEQALTPDLAVTAVGRDRPAVFWFVAASAEGDGLASRVVWAD